MTSNDFKMTSNENDKPVFKKLKKKQKIFQEVVVQTMLTLVME